MASEKLSMSSPFLLVILCVVRLVCAPFPKYLNASNRLRLSDVVAFKAPQVLTRF